MSRKTLGLIAAALAVLLLTASLAAHLYSRWRFQRSATEFLATFPDVVSALDMGSLEQTFADLAHEAPEEASNAARWLQAGGAAIVCTQEENLRLTELTFSPFEEWGIEDQRFAKKLVNRNEKAFELMAKAVPLDGSNYGLDYTNVLEIELPNLLHLLRGAKMLQVRARLAFAEGDADAGLNDLTTISRLVDSLRDDDVLIFALVGIASEKILLGGVRDSLESGALRSAESREALLERLALLIPADDLLATMHRLTALDAAAMTFALRQGRYDFLDSPPSPHRRLSIVRLSTVADSLQAGIDAKALLEVPFARDPMAYLPKGMVGLGSAYRTSIAKAQALLAQRYLMLAALHLERLGEGCDSLGPYRQPDPFTGELFRCTGDPQSGITLALHDSSAAIERVSRNPAIRMLNVKLPPRSTDPTDSAEVLGN